MGGFDGWSVGCEVCENVGIKEGTSDGFEVGSIDGICVGILLR